MLGSQIRLITPSEEMCCRFFGATGGNVSFSVTHPGGGASLSSVWPVMVSNARTV